MPTTAAVSRCTARFYKAAVAQGAMTEADARRCLAAIVKTGRDLDAAKVAIKLGALTPETAEQVRAALAARGVKPVAAPARRERGRALLLVGGALLAGTLTGIAAVVAMHDPAQEVAVAVAPAPSSATGVTATTPSTPSDAAERPSRLDTALALTLRSARDLAEGGRERAALEIVDEFVAAHGDTPEAAQERARLVARCEDVLDEASRRLREAAGSGRDGAADVRRLRDRLPAAFGARVDALALELRATPRDAVPTPTWRDDVLVAAAPQGPVKLPDVTTASDEPRTPADDEGEDDAADDLVDDTFDPSRGAGTFGPRDTDAGSTGRDDDGDAGGAPAAPSGGPAADDTSSPVALAVRDLLHVSHAFRDGKVDARYDFSEQGQRADFQLAGFDKAEINPVNGSHAYATDFELGAGSRGLGRLAHVLPLAGDVTIEFTLWLNHSTTRSNLVFMLGNEVGVRWGQQLVKVSRSGAMRALTRGEPDRTIFREERQVKVKLTRVGDTLTVECNGRRVAEKAFKPGELDGRFGLIASDLRMIVTDLRIQGVVDAARL